MKRILFGLLAGIGACVTQSLVVAQPVVKAPTAAPQEVLIEAAILQVSLDDSTGLGSKAHEPPGVGDRRSGLDGVRPHNPPSATRLGIGTATNMAGGQLSGFGNIETLGADFDSTLTALAQDSRVKVLQRPRIQTSHGVTATLFVGESRPYPLSSAHGAMLPASATGQMPIGTTLEINPLVKADGRVEMDLRLKIERFEHNMRIENVGLVPVTSSREAQAKVEVRDRETILLGGLAGWDRKQPAPALPFPKDLPGVRFAQSSARHERTELMVLIRPTLLASEQGAGR
jgi:type II secretory pathway component GspD/PulD (secretin)